METNETCIICQQLKETHDAEICNEVRRILSERLKKVA